MHLLSALDQASGVVVAQVSVDVKTNEIPLFATLLDQIPDLEGTLVTGDALHAQVGHLNYLQKGRQAERNAGRKRWSTELRATHHSDHVQSPGPGRRPGRWVWQG